MSARPLSGIASDALEIVARNPQRSLLGDSRPGSDLHDRTDRAGTRSRANLFQAFAEMSAQLEPFGLDELQLPPDRLCQLDELEPEPCHRCGQLRELRAER